MNRLAFASAALFALVPGCSDDSSSSEPPIVKSDLARDKSPDSAGIDDLVAGNTQFAADLYQLAAVSETGKNLFISPHSISSALAMTYAGARGNTATQMASVFGFTDSVHTAQNALDLELESRGADADSDEIPFRLTTANSIWGQEGKEFQSPFLDTLAVNYGAGLHVLDFLSDPSGSRDIINGWVSDKTNEKIDELLPEGSISSDTRLVLTNAIYFSAAWEQPFDASNTANKPFELSDAFAPISVPTLSSSVEANYSAGDGWKAVEIPYDGRELSMVVVVPNNLQTFEAALTPTVLENITSSMSEHAVDLELPKFKFRAPLGLSGFLQALGMTDAFSGAADFSGIDGTRELVIADVIHEGFVSIDEKGTEAAAATAVLLNDTAAPEPATLHADRPFVFFIRDIETKEILFLGRVVNPTL